MCLFALYPLAVFRKAILPIFSVVNRSVVMYKIVFLSVCALCASTAFAVNDELTRGEYIDMWKEEAVYQMAVHGIPASITLAQGILESRDGNSRLAKEGNNHFGIKCHSDWEGKRIYEDDDERNECFRQYRNARESFDDHSEFLKKARYSQLFELELTDYKGWARGLKECGYATSPEYAKSLIRIIEENNLQQYDEQGVRYARRREVPDRTEPSPQARITPSEDKKSAKRSSQPAREERAEITIAGNHEVKVSANNIKYIVAREGDTRESIAKEIDLNVLILNRFNDFNSNTNLKPGDIVYLQPKRMRAQEAEYVAVEGDTWFSISHEHGIKLKQLCKLNGASPEQPVQAGKQIIMKKR
jgi:LysM repeat protein